MINNSETSNDDNPATKPENVLKNDLPDSPHDEERMKIEEVILDLPDVEDIPGQENIVPPKMNLFADTTISSDDEEGRSVFGEEDEEI